MTVISAHRQGVGFRRALENTPAAVQYARFLPAEFIEVDVHRLKDGTLVCFHDETVHYGGRSIRLAYMTRTEFEKYVPRPLFYVDALSTLAGYKGVQVDLKFSAPQEAVLSCAVKAVDIFGEENVMVTSLDDEVISTLTRHFALHNSPVKIGLSLGRDLAGLPWHRRIAVRLSELFPAKRVRRCGANCLSVHHRLARWRVARWARCHDIPVAVWTVDEPGDLRYWLHRDVFMVVTDFPVRAHGIENTPAPERGVL